MLSQHEPSPYLLTQRLSVCCAASTVFSRVFQQISRVVLDDDRRLERKRRFHIDHFLLLFPSSFLFFHESFSSPSSARELEGREKWEKDFFFLREDDERRRSFITKGILVVCVCVGEPHPSSGRNDFPGIFEIFSLSFSVVSIHRVSHLQHP